jgi:hypothetical protein
MEEPGRRGEEVKIGNEDVEEKSRQGMLRNESVLKAKDPRPTALAELSVQWTHARRVSTTA